MEPPTPTPSGSSSDSTPTTEHHTAHLSTPCLTHLHVHTPKCRDTQRHSHACCVRVDQAPHTTSAATLHTATPHAQSTPKQHSTVQARRVACERCDGSGNARVSDTWSTCPTCRGERVVWSDSLAGVVDLDWFI